jgi:hypothetical protein
MIGQDHERVEREGIGASRRGDCLAEACDLIDEQGLPSLQQVDREEEASTRDKHAAIVGDVEQDSTSVLALRTWKRRITPTGPCPVGYNPPYVLPQFVDEGDAKAIYRIQRGNNRQKIY